MPHYSDDWVSPHAANWRKHLGHLHGVAHRQGLEIGSHEGRSANWFLDHVLTHPTARLTCVDDWTYKPHREFHFDNNTAAARESGRLVKRKGFSRHVLPTLPEGHFDFAYVDGSHEAADALLDGLLVLHLLKSGGILILDDYGFAGTWQRQVHLHVKHGLDALLQIAAHKLEVIDRGYQITARKR
jgi:predicted O-methyltransferase YrrM